MQVSGMNDSNVAIIGGNTPKEFMIANTPEFFNILSSSLYSDPILAIVRETLCNAWDASPKAPKITFTEDSLSIEDGGFGIPDEDIVHIYGTYGLSTKTNDSSQTGGFGLGCKSPFAYTDNFEVVSCCNGTLTIYQMTRSHESVDGKPAIIKVTSVPTESHGLKVTIPIKQGDSHCFEKALYKVITCSERDVTLNGQTPEHFPEFNKFIFGSNFGRDFEISSHICIKYGEVIYPLKNSNEYKYSKAYEKLEQLTRKVSYCCLYNQRLIIKAEPDSLTVTPSREELRYTEHNQKVIHELLNDTWHTLHTRVGDKSVQYELAYFKSLEMDWMDDTTLASIGNAMSRVGRDLKYFTEETVYQRFNAFLEYEEVMMDFYSWKLAASPFKNSFLKLAKNYPKLLLRVAYPWFQKHVLRSIKKSFEGTGLDTSKLNFYYSNFHRVRGTFTFDTPTSLSVSDVAHFLIPTIYIGAKTCTQVEGGGIAPSYRIVYQSSPTKIQKNKEALEKLGYKVIVLRSAASTKKTESKKSIMCARLDDVGMLQLRAVTWYQVDYAMQLRTSDELPGYLEHVEAAFIYNNRGHNTKFDSDALGAIKKYFGSKVVVVKSQKDLKYLMGTYELKSLEEFIEPIVRDYFSKPLVYSPTITQIQNAVPPEYREGITNFFYCCQRYSSTFNYPFLEKTVQSNSLFWALKELGIHLGIEPKYARIDPSYNKFLKDMTQNNIKFCSIKADEAFIYRHILSRK